MTLKELRMSKDLTQEQAAILSSVSLRTMKAYENSSTLVDTPRYNAIYQALERYVPSKPMEKLLYRGKFYTNIQMGVDLIPFANKVYNYQKRDCFVTLEKYIKGDYDGKVCILYGLRRTGKTTMLFQMISELPLDKVAYVKMQTTDTMARLSMDLDTLYHMGFRYIFIDEITLLEDFIGTAAILSDIYSMKGMKIVLSGTDSLSFIFADRDELYARNIMIHTSIIPFREYSRLLDINSIDTYIEYGGTLMKENMLLGDGDSRTDELAFKDDESTRKYIDTAISRNIQNSLKYNRFGSRFNSLDELYRKNELTNAINRIIEDMNHRFVLDVVQDRFKSHDLGSAKELLLHDASLERAQVLNMIDVQKVTEMLKAIIEVKDREQLTVEITQGILNTIKNYLRLLDLIYESETICQFGENKNYYFFTQPGMRYSIAKALVYSLMQDDYFKTISTEDKNYVIEKILDDVKGRMLEDIVLLETKKINPKENIVAKYKFGDSTEYDMVIYDIASNTCSIYEIKHSDKISDKQIMYLIDKEKCSLIEHLYGKITGKYVLYRGENKRIGEIEYLNVEEYLRGLGKKKDIPNKETKEALAEYKEMKEDKEKYKRYDSFSDIEKETK